MINFEKPPDFLERGLFRGFSLPTMTAIEAAVLFRLAPRLRPWLCHALSARRGERVPKRGEKVAEPMSLVGP